ncbi:MAG: undecaprenyldiphospho-muramoylpentapeptide beta-N-acetylglucosaminyltransferase [Rhodothermia bacterium]|nr:undecaprenyldiphospho-muramoylpentapeptide beta-N-acetylglucosaminyltransferase [Rhodothermia bacterium]
MTTSRSDRPRILFAAGGTGGHVYPAIAVADEVRSMTPEAAIIFAGTRERLEWRVVPASGYEISPISAAGLQRKLTARNLAMPFKVGRGFVQSVSLVRAFDPDVVVGTGGYVTGPVVAAGSLLGRKTLIQEQNAYPGITNRLLGKRVDEVHVAFPEAVDYFPDDRCVVSGNPTRSDLVGASREEARSHFGIPDEARVLFAFGGSLGSQAMNEILMRLWPSLTGKGTLLLWQTGPRYFDRVRQAVGDHADVRLLEYVERMDLAYAAADLALCRSGAITCSELLVTGTPAILVPSPNVAEDHQTKNAVGLARSEAAIVIAERDLEARLVAAVAELLPDKQRLSEMARNARSAAHPDAASRLAQAVLRLARQRIQKQAGGA